MASGDTKTEAMLNVLGNGGSGDEFRGCCNTKTQSYILDAIDRVQGVEDEVEELKNNPDVVDIVDTYADLEAYDTQHLTNNDIIRVLQDETHSGNSTYYRFTKNPDTWTFIGEISGGGGGDTVYSTVTTSNSSTGGAVYIGNLDATQTEQADPTTTDNHYKYFWALPTDNTTKPLDSDICILGTVTGNTGERISIGHSASAVEEGVAIGHSAKTEYHDSVAVGHSATSSVDAVAVGHSAKSGSNDAVAVGHTSKAEGMYSVAVGGSSNVDSFGAIGIGGFANALSNYAIDLHSAPSNQYGVKDANSEASICIGARTKITNTPYSISLGAGAQATRQGELNIGAVDPDTAAHGFNNTSYRVIGGVHDGQLANDAATVGQINATIDAINSALNTNIPHVGAQS